MKIIHTCVRVQNLEKSIDFYEKAFGFKETKRKDHSANKFILVYLSLPGDDYELELTYNFDHEPYNLGDGYGHIALSVEDMVTLHDKQKAAGYEVTDLKGLPGKDANYYFIIDPDGYKIEVIQA